MRRRLVIELVLAAVFLGGGIAGYFQVVPQLETNFSPLSKLMVANPKIADISANASYAAPTPVDEAGLDALEAGAAADPGQTGAYTSQWFGLGAKGGELTTFLEMLPNATLGAQAETEQFNENLASSVITGEKDKVVSRFAVPGVADSDAVYYLVSEPDKKGANNKEIPQPPQPAYVGLIRVGRVVERMDLQGPASTKAGLLQFAERSAALIRARVAHWPSMAYTGYPLGASLAWFGGVAALILLVFLVPFGAGRVAAARLAREEARRRYQLASRGAKVVRRRRVRR